MREHGLISNRITDSDLLQRIQNWDPVALVLVAHAAALIALGDVFLPDWAIALVVVLGLWRFVLGAVARRLTDDLGSPWILAREGGSLVIAAGVVIADGGTESPFFFWPLVLLAWQALQLSVRQLLTMVGVAVATYLTVIVVSGDVTAASVGRLGLLLAFSGLVVVGRARLESFHRQAVKSERLLNDAFDAAPVGIMVVPLSSESAYMNGAATRMGLGLALESYEGGKPLRRMVFSTWEDQFTKGPELFVLDDANRGVRYLRVITTPHGTPSDQAVVVCAEDVTAQVLAGEEQRSFMRFAGHQLRTPLTPIIAYSELLKSGQVGAAELPSVAEEIARSARDLQYLFERMVSVASLEDGSQRRMTFARAGDIISGVGPEGIEGVVAHGDSNVLVWCEPELLASALHELVDNGKRFGVPPVHLAWARENGTVEFRVWDSGPGPDPQIPEDVLFASWGDLEATKMMTPQMGTRLGLPHARILVGLSGGELSLSRDQDGWAFTIRVPGSPLAKASQSGATLSISHLQTA